MITIKEIAKECNVSITTVSNILNGKPKASEETRQKVMRVVEEKGYHPNYIAQGLRRQKTRMIGIIAEDIAQFTMPEVIEGIMEHCEKRNYRTIVQNLRLYSRWQDSWYDDDIRYHSVLDPALRELRSIRADGIIYVAGHARILHCFLDDLRVPAVMAYAYYNTDEVPSLVLDDEQGAYEMVKYLISMGHRKIGFVGGLKDNIHEQKRLQGIKKALSEANIPFDSSLFCFGGWNRETGYREVPKVISRGVTAVFCMADRIAGGVYDYMEEHHLSVGKDFSVAGFDNQDIAAYFKPALTTVDLPLREIGQRSAELLIDRLEADSKQCAEGVIKIPCRLIIRDSVKKLNCNL